jgi:hypothetical protein
MPHVVVAQLVPDRPAPPAIRIEQTTQRTQLGVRVWAGHSFDYGSLWWLTSDGGGGDVIAASGAPEFITDLAK